jgi:hypothetical protein
MKKAILITVGIFLTLFTIYFLIFLFQPSAILDFYLSPEGLEFSNQKEIFLKIKPFSIDIQLTDTQRHKSNLLWSPNKKYLAFAERVMEPAERPFDREWAIKIINPRIFKIKTIFIGDSHTSEHQWLNGNTIRVYINAGTGVRAYRDIDIDISEPFIAVEHKSPEFWIPVKVE